MQSLMMPYVLVRSFLSKADQASVLDWTLANAAAFLPSRIDAGALDIERRRSLTLTPPGDVRKMLRAALKPRIGELLAGLGIAPFGSRLEMEAAAHGDGAMFLRHIDTGVRIPRAKSRRLSAVYYYHRQPKAFEGGCLRLHALVGNERVDIEPEQNMLLVFPSYAPHEVMPIGCASGKFEDSRFAVNIWMHDATRLDAVLAEEAGEAGESLPLTVGQDRCGDGQNET